MDRTTKKVTFEAGPGRNTLFFKGIDASSLRSLRVKEENIKYNLLTKTKINFFLEQSDELNLSLEAENFSVFLEDESKKVKAHHSGSCFYSLSKKGNGAYSEFLDKIKKFMEGKSNIFAVFLHPFFPEDVIIEGNLGLEDFKDLRKAKLRNSPVVLNVDKVINLLEKKESKIDLSKGDLVQILEKSLEGERAVVERINHELKTARVVLLGFPGEITLELDFNKMVILKKNE